MHYSLVFSTFDFGSIWAPKLQYHTPYDSRKPNLAFDVFSRYFICSTVYIQARLTSRTYPLHTPQHLYWPTFYTNRLSHRSDHDSTLVFAIFVISSLFSPSLFLVFPSCVCGGCTSSCISGFLVFSSSRWFTSLYAFFGIFLSSFFFRVLWDRVWYSVFLVFLVAVSFVR